MGEESKIGGVSVRGIIALILVIGVLVLAGFKIPIDERIHMLVFMAVSFYLGQKTKV